MKFFGKCNDMDRAMRHCLRKEVCIVFYFSRKNALDIIKLHKLTELSRCVCGYDFFSVIFFFTETGEAGAEQAARKRDEEEAERRAEEGALRI